MLLSRVFSFDYFEKYLYTDDFIIVASYSNVERSKRLSELLPTARVVTIEYSISKSKQGTLDDQFMIKTINYESLLSRVYYSLYQDLYSFVEQLNKESKRIVIDISGIHLRFLGALLAILPEFSWESFFCAYTEPKMYPRVTGLPDNQITPGIVGSFDLNTSFWGYDEIPNLKTVSSSRNNFVWIAFLGFEGKRASAVYSEISGDSSIMIPVITMPPIRPGWSNLAFDANQILFENANVSAADIQYTDALNPFSAYNLIESIQSDNSKKHIVISPLGTRPVSLGALLYAVTHEEVEIYFDTPKQSSGKAVGCGKTHFYDILTVVSLNK